MSDEDTLIVEDDENDSEVLYLLFSAGSSLFAVDAMKVQEMVVLPKTIPIPEQPDWFRGVMNLRGNTYKVVDFRKRIGMQGVNEEIEELVGELDERENEHKQWIDQLEEAVMHDKAFKGQKDPHQCKFGKWYDSYTSDNVTVKMELKKFDQPHKAIHHTAEEALNLKNEGNVDAAMELIRSRRDTELAKMVELFENMKKTLQETNKEISIIIDSGERPDAICVDTVVSVESLTEDKDSKLAFGTGKADSFSKNAVIGKRKGGDELVLIIDPAWIFRSTGKIDPSAIKKAAAELKEAHPTP
jgi:chemotaxis signal transduction protein